MSPKTLKDYEQMHHERIRDIDYRIKKLESQGINVINLAFGAQGFETPVLIRDAAMESLKLNPNQITPLEGLTELRLEICDYIDRTRDFRPDLDQIMIGPSTKNMIYTTLATLIKSGDEVIVTDPCIPYYASLATLLGAKVKFVPRMKDDKFKIDLSELEKSFGKRTKAIILGTPHNPTGNILSNRELQFIWDLVDKNKAYLISDETYSQIVFTGRHVSLATIDRAVERTIIIENLSYTFSIPGWGLGFCLAPDKIIEDILRITADLNAPIPYFIQFALAEAFKMSDSILPEILDKYKKYSKLLVHGLNDLPGFKCQSPPGGIYAFPNISATGQSSNELVNYLLDKSGIAVLPGDVFGQNGKGYLRLSYANSVDRINEGLIRLEESF
jgi:aspartate/methionine/tyrosine aminotransferase